MAAAPNILAADRMLAVPGFDGKLVLLIALNRQPSRPEAANSFSGTNPYHGQELETGRYLGQSDTVEPGRSGLRPPSKAGIPASWVTTSTEDPNR